MSNLQEAVESYAFDIIMLGNKIPATREGIHAFENRIQNAFREELGDLVVCVSVDHVNDIRITLV